MKQYSEVKGIKYNFLDSYCEAAFQGKNDYGIRIHIDKMQDENCILLYQEEQWRWLCKIDSDDILLPYYLFNGLENKTWYFYIGRLREQCCDVRCLRNTAVIVSNEAKAVFFDKRNLYGFVIRQEKNILLPHYEVGQELSICSCQHEEDIYQGQMLNEILAAEFVDDTEEILLHMKCKDIRGSYIGIFAKDCDQVECLESICHPYTAYLKKKKDIYMDFRIPQNGAELKYDIAWRYHGNIYTAPLSCTEDLPRAELMRFHVCDSSHFEMVIQLDEKACGNFQKAILVPCGESWNRKLEKAVSAVQLKGNHTTSFRICVDSRAVLKEIEKWELQICTNTESGICRIPVVVSMANQPLCQAVTGRELFDYGNTTWKLVFGIRNGRWTVERKFGHNALFKKNRLSREPEESLEQFLIKPGISPKGEMYGEWIRQKDGRMKIRLYQKMDKLLEACLVMYHTQWMGVLHIQPLELEGGILKDFQIELPFLDVEGRFPKPVNSLWFRVTLALRTKDGIFFTFLKQYDLPVDTIRDGVLYDERNLYFAPIGEECICEIPMSVVPYYSGNRLLSMKYVRPEQLYRSQFCNELLEVSIRRDIMVIRVRCRDCSGVYKGILMEYRKVKEDDAETYLIPYESLTREEDGSFLMIAKVDMKKYYMRMLYWDIRTAFEIEGVLYHVACYSNDKKFLRKYDGVFVDRTYPNENSIMFPYVTANSSVALMHRETVPQDHWRFRLKEKLAMLLFKCFRRYWENKNIYLIFEKYCTMAQDNGYYFFKYCMEADVEKEFSGHIYYVLDRNAADWKKIIPYKEHVVPFLSLKHLIYLQACKLMISTDTKGHAYVWRSMGSAIKKLSYQKKLVFLQHGVTAFKRGHFERGTNVGCESFITTSQFEHDIICNYLGYTEEEVPITGFARWDVLHDKSEGHREILMMPTWRTWLDDAENEVFAQSEYCKNYMALLNDPRLDEILKEQNVTLNFYLHPKFRKFITEFSVVSDHIHLIPFGEAALNELMMECNMLITDFSSVAWDVYYMNKPVVFYHFDIEDANKTLGFYMDMEHDMFGDRAETPEELMQLIIEYVERNFRIKENYSDERSKYFAYVDDDNSARIWKAIQERHWE